MEHGTNRKVWDVSRVLNWSWEKVIGPLERASRDLFNRNIVFVCCCLVLMVSQGSWVFYGAVPQHVQLDPRVLAPSARWVGGVELWSRSHRSFRWRDSDSECPTAFTVSWPATVTLTAMSCKMYTDKRQRWVRRLDTQRGEEQFGNEGENDCRHHWKRNCDAVAENHLEGFCRSCCIFPSSIQYHLCNQFIFFFFTFTGTNHVPYFINWFWPKLKMTVLSLRFCPSSTLSNKMDLWVKYTFQNTPQPQ